MSSDYALKYLFRVGHIAPVIAVAGRLLVDFLTYPKTPFRDNAKAQFGYNILTLILTISGYVNYLLLQPRQNLREKRIPYVVLIHIKLLSMLLFIDPLADYIWSDPKKVLFARFHTAALWIVVSPALRYYREHFTEQNKLKTK